MISRRITIRNTIGEQYDLLADNNPQDSWRTKGSLGRSKYATQLENNMISRRITIRITIGEKYDL